MADRIDMVIFGASGFTGKRAIPIIYKLSKSNGRNLTWGIAGRSEDRLKSVLKEMSKTVDADLTSVPIIIADVNDDNSLQAMAKRTQVVINCCGPYRFYGEPVVKACVNAGTHHVDVSGEPQYMEQMQLKYHKAAEDNEVYVVSACGSDSIPSDMGIVFLQQEFKGTLNSVETFIEVDTDGKLSGPVFNYATLVSLVYGIADSHELKALRTKLYPTKLPNLKPKLNSSGIPHKNKLVDGWLLPFPGADRPVARRSQRYFYHTESKRPVQVETYFIVKSFSRLMNVVTFGSLLYLLAKSESGRKLLLKYPTEFSGGLFSHESPLEKDLDKVSFKLTFFGEGWEEKLSGPDDEYSTPPNKSIVATVKGKNPGYGAANICAVLAAIITITESDKMPGKGGVYPPGAAFAKTSLIKQLNENGVTFELVSEHDMPYRWKYMNTSVLLSFFYSHLHSTELSVRIQFY